MGAKRAEASARTGTDKGCNGRRGRRRRHGHKDTKGRGDKRPSEQRVAATSSQSIEPPRSSLCGSVSEDEKTFLSWSPNVSVRVVYVFLVTFNSHVQISCPSFKIYFLTGRYGNANRPFLVLLTGSQSLPPHLTTLYYNSESKQASSLREEGGGAGGAPSCCVETAPTEAVCILVSSLSVFSFIVFQREAVSRLHLWLCITRSLSCLCVKLSDNYFAVNSRSCGDREGGSSSTVRTEEKGGEARGETRKTKR